ncbi:leucyl/phenylalanyl-tRNA--protein transferase [Membranihabitans maritimus]|uniref:leucyl/phenylalanyl-tRNA--protein transferase n=1 Tax=Membranihabitans maritimus TaxID=2904244 RepID=UPI001EFFB7F1|nr:leucyl/phenylalanyl-tRNA--protein transferase [Membranihabitans maritimus]
MGLHYPDFPMYFPHPFLSNEDGLLAVGGDLGIERLLLAYRFGIFPWYSEDQPILWWSPKKRFIIDVENMHMPKSMRTYFNNNIFTVTVDQHFESVIDRCQNITRSNQDGTWITSDIKKAYTKLHSKGYAHSVEVWQENKMVGGLYGVGIGKIFSGESMFSEISNASKYAALFLGNILREKGYTTIDCQQYSSHMERLGGYSISQAEYFDMIKENLLCESFAKKWD